MPCLVSLFCICFQGFIEIVKFIIIGEFSGFLHIFIDVHLFFFLAEFLNTFEGVIGNVAKIGKQAFFKANPDCPVYRELKDIITKTFGVADILREALASLADKIMVGFIYGSMAGGEFSRGSDVDVMVIGNISFAEIVSALSPVQEVLSREINPSVYPPGEFKARLSEKQHFLRSVLNSPKIFIIGNQNELEELAR